MVFAFHPQVSAGGGIPRVSTHQRKEIFNKPAELALKSPEVKMQPKVTKPSKSSKRIIQVNNPGKLVHQVQKGDRLDKISMMYYGTHHRHREILDANPGLDPNRLRLGKKIVIPDIRGGLPKQSQVFIERNNPLVRDYLVKPGDVLGRISRKELGSSKHIKRILEVNPGLDPKKIKVGQVISLPILDLNKKL